MANEEILTWGDKLKYLNQVISDIGHYGEDNKDWIIEAKHLIYVIDVLSKLAAFVGDPNTELEPGDLQKEDIGSFITKLKKALTDVTNKIGNSAHPLKPEDNKYIFDILFNNAKIDGKLGKDYIDLEKSSGLTGADLFASPNEDVTILELLTTLSTFQKSLEEGSKTLETISAKEIKMFNQWFLSAASLSGTSFTYLSDEEEGGSFGSTVKTKILPVDTVLVRTPENLSLAYGDYNLSIRLKLKTEEEQEQRGLDQEALRIYFGYINEDKYQPLKGWSVFRDALPKNLYGVINLPFSFNAASNQPAVWIKTADNTNANQGFGVNDVISIDYISVSPAITAVYDIVGSSENGISELADLQN